MRLLKLFFIISFLSLFACSRTLQCDSVFRYNESKDIATLDPAFARNQTIIWPVNQIFNGLVQMDSALNVVPCIAKSWSVSDNNLEYIFNLRTDVKFHNSAVFEKGVGRNVTAEDFVYSFNRIVNPKTASSGKWIFSNVQTDSKNGGYSFFADNDSTFRIVLETPSPAFLGILTMKYCSVVPFEAVDFFGSSFGVNPVGTGPFCFNSWYEGEKLILSKNNNYFERDSKGKQLPYLDGVSITFVNDKQSEFLEFLQGRLDFISGLSSANKDELLTRSGDLKANYIGKIVMDKMPYLNTEYLAFLSDSNLNALPVEYNNILVRKAINCSFDRTKMMLYLRNNIGYPAVNGFLPRGLHAYNSEYNVAEYNPELAKNYLEEAGFPKGKGLPALTVSTTSDYVDLCQFIQHQLFEVGITLNIDVLPGSVYRQKMAMGELGFFRASWIADFPDSENYLSLFYSKNSAPNGPNYTRFSDAYYDKMFELALNKKNSAERIDMYQQLNRYVMDKSIVVPLYYDEVIRFYNSGIEGFVGNPLNNLELKTVVKLPKK